MVCFVKIKVKIIYLIFVARFFKSEGSVIAVQIAKQANQHLMEKIITVVEGPPCFLFQYVPYFAKWRMYVEKEGSIDVVAGEFSKMSFIPAIEMKVRFNSCLHAYRTLNVLPNMIRLVQLIKASSNRCD